MSVQTEFKEMLCQQNTLGLVAGYLLHGEECQILWRWISTILPVQCYRISHKTFFKKYIEDLDQLLEKGRLEVLSIEKKIKNKQTENHINKDGM